LRGALLMLAGLAGIACSSSQPSTQQLSTPPPTQVRDGPSPTELRLVRIATAAEPVALAVRDGDPALYIAENGGRVVAIRGGSVDPESVLDLSGEVSQGGEQGLLGIAFSPDGRFLYANYTDLAGDTNVVEVAMGERAADPSSLRQVLLVEQPFANHNGGNLAFGPDGFLYIGLGDGGSAGDPQGNAQDLGTLLGKMLRIDPRPSGDDPYGVPADNPFHDRPGARPEIWAYGLRNPWRYSFDRATGDLWIGDVGQSDWEEIDVQAAASGGGENYGWNAREGAHPFGSTEAPELAIDPVFEYDRAGGACTVIGGFVYRGAAIPELDGAYLYSDLCVGEVQAIRLRDGQVRQIDLDLSVQTPSSFGQDTDGELYVLSLAGGVYRLEPGG
jgi:glucose/arabinose dehydrogenase